MIAQFVCALRSLAVSGTVSEDPLFFYYYIDTHTHTFYFHLSALNTVGIVSYFNKTFIVTVTVVSVEMSRCFVLFFNRFLRIDFFLFCVVKSGRSNNNHNTRHPQIRCSASSISNRFQSSNKRINTIIGHRKREDGKIEKK